MNVLNEAVLVLNKNWQAINITSVEEALKQMYTDVVTALDYTDDGDLVPTSWDNWVKLPVRDRDRVIHTSKIAFRAPTIVVTCDFARVPMVRPQLDNQGVAERDGKICQYTGVLAEDGNVDHVIPKGRGGQHTWENVVWSRKDINTLKGKQLNEEAGLKLIRKPREPLLTPKTVRIKPRSDRPEWNAFLIKSK